MNTRAHMSPRRALIAFSAALFVLAFWQASYSPPSALSTTHPRPKLSPDVKAQLPLKQPILLSIYLAENSLLENLPSRATRLLTTNHASTIARRDAARAPHKRWNSEAAAARAAERSRNQALPLIRRAAKAQVAETRRVSALITKNGGEVLAEVPIPNRILARVTPSTLPKLEASPQVTAITTAKLPVSMAAPITGAPTWHAAGFTGAGSSADAKGSPDAVVFDTGIRTTHTAFKSRLPGDCTTCDGTGPTRVTSPLVRGAINPEDPGESFTGSKHANNIAATIADTALSRFTFPNNGGIAYGLDKLYDPYEAYNPYLWDLGINTPRPAQFPTDLPANDPGLAGGDDLPEVINYSAGEYNDTQDLHPGTVHWDALEDRFGILNTIAAGNCGLPFSGFTNCILDETHRVASPGTNPNVLTVGGFTSSTTYPDTSGYEPWPNTSPGPTWGGRKKPDLVATPYGAAGTPSAIDDNAWTSGGQGTSYAAPVAAGGALLLASVGVYKPTAQKAILINSAEPVLAQTYWTPRSGWGAVNLTRAYYQRGYYANASVHGSGANSARFFAVTGSAIGDRATLVWNRRTTTNSILTPSWFATTNLDLSQLAPADASGATVTSTGGSDEFDSVDTDQSVTTANPMPGNGDDGEDNVEQIRSTATGNQILKVKAHSALDGAATEPFSLASAKPISALQSPIPTLGVLPDAIKRVLGGQVTLTLQVINPSSDLTLDDASVSLDALPDGVSAVGPTSANLGDITPGGSAGTTFTVKGDTEGIKVITARVQGTAYGEPFSGEASVSLTFDGTPPEVALDALPAFSTSAEPLANWSASDALTDVASYDAEVQTAGGPWSRVVDAGGATSVPLTDAAEGQLIAVRVRARDEVGNTADWALAETTIDAVPPEIKFGTASTPKRGTLAVPVSASNVGAPITSVVHNFHTSVPLTVIAPLSEPFATWSNPYSNPIQPVLYVKVTDQLGRSTEKRQRYSLESRFTDAALRITSAKVKKGRLTLKGRISTEFSGRVSITIKRRGKTGTRKVVKHATVSDGRWSTRVRLKAGRYRVQVESGAVGDVRKGSAAKSLSVR